MTPTVARSEVLSSYQGVGTVNKNIAVGFNVMKVEINRPWFDPSIFITSGDYVRLSGSPFSKGFDPLTVHDAKSDLNVRNKTCREFSQNFILPAYPIAFLAAKDITISVTSASATDKSAHDFVQKSSTTGVSPFAGQYNASRC